METREKQKKEDARSVIIIDTLEHFVRDYKVAASDREREATDFRCREFLNALFSEHPNIRYMYKKMYEHMKRGD